MWCGEQLPLFWDELFSNIWLLSYTSCNLTYCNWIPHFTMRLTTMLFWWSFMYREECKEQVHGVVARFKKFKTMAEAEVFMTTNDPRDLTKYKKFVSCSFKNHPWFIRMWQIFHVILKRNGAEQELGTDWIELVFLFICGKFLACFCKEPG